MYHDSKLQNQNERKLNYRLSAELWLKIRTLWAQGQSVLLQWSELFLWDKLPCFRFAKNKGGGVSRMWTIAKIFPPVAGFLNVLTLFLNVSSHFEIHFFSRQMGGVIPRNSSDDIQGTGAVALGGLMGAVRAATGGDRDPKRLHEQRIFIAGAGTLRFKVLGQLGWISSRCVERVKGQQKITWLQGSIWMIFKSNVDLSRRRRTYDERSGYVELKISSVRVFLLLSVCLFVRHFGGR